MKLESTLWTTLPAPTIRVRFLPAPAACMALACVDLAAVWRNSAAGPWADAVAATLPAPVRAAFPAIDVFFGHGFCLRDAALVLLGPDHPALATWDGFVTEWAHRPLERFSALVGLALAMRLDAHGHLSGGDGEAVAARLASDAIARREALVDLLEEGDRAGDSALRAEVLALGADLEALRARLLTVLRGFGALALPAGGDPAWRRLSAAAMRLAAVALPPDPVAAFPLVTGRGVPPDEREALASAREVLFLCCPHLGDQCSFGMWEGRLFVYFEPPAAARTAEPAAPGPAAEAAFAALANRARLELLAVLGARGEMYAQEMVEATGLPQATVATHLAELTSAGLVASERRGHRRYYAVVPEAGRRLAAEVLRLFALPPQ